MTYLYYLQPCNKIFDSGQAAINYVVARCQIAISDLVLTTKNRQGDLTDDPSDVWSYHIRHKDRADFMGDQWVITPREYRAGDGRG